jgi:hypothetical protein
MALSGYTAIEAAVIARLIEHFSDELDETVCAGGELDIVLNNLFEQNREYCCVLEMGGGQKRRREQFNRDVWNWTIYGIFMIRYTGEGIEQKVRDIVDRLATALDGNTKRLGGVSPLTEITRIEDPDPVKVNDVPFYWIPFMIEAMDD